MPPAPCSAYDRWLPLALIGGAAMVAMIGASPEAGGWNDGASLATVETLVDQGTFAIDRSIFVKPALRRSGAATPYPADDAQLNEHGTFDKVYVDGHYYAAKPFVPAVLMAGQYWLLQQVSGVRAADSPRRFIYGMTLLSTGLAYVVAVGCVYALARRVLDSHRRAAMLAGGLALGSVALVYSRSVNGHLQQLAAVAGLFWSLHAFAARLRDGERPWMLATSVGALLGLAYVFDQGVGPAVLVSVAPLVAWRTLRSARTAPLALIVALAAAPWIVAQHWLNFELGHTIAAINSRPEHFIWPGSPWNSATMSGGYSHATPLRCVLYAAQILVGKKGFLLHNPLLIVGIAGGVWLVVRRWRRLPELPEIVCALACGALMWMVYSLGSNNYSGQCISVRWLLPFLAPGCYLLAVFLRERPEKWGDVLVVAGWSVMLNAICWYHGPWHGHVVPAYWFILAAMLASWILYVHRQKRVTFLARRSGELPAVCATAARRW